MNRFLAVLASLLFTASPTFAKPRHVPAKTVHCGVERWSIKVGTDPDARQIDMSTVTDTTIHDLRQLTPPNDIKHFQGRATGVEDQLWELDATLTLFKTEADGDFHLVLQDDNGKTMIAEIPNPVCVAASSPFHADVVAMRKGFTQHFNNRTAEKNLTEHIRITGVGFFDIPHSGAGQTGHAPNNIELHPVIDLEFVP